MAYLIALSILCCCAVVAAAVGLRDPVLAVFGRSGRSPSSGPADADAPEIVY
jgi:hypothetical protein